MSFLQQTAIDFTNTAYKDELENLQANILKGHGRPSAWHVFLHFGDRSISTTKSAIKKYARGLTSSLQQLEDTAKRKNEADFDGGLVRCMFLSRTGYQKLKIFTSIWGNQDKHKAFQQGLKKRQKVLQDPVEDKWEKGFRGDIDALIIIADNKVGNLATELNEIEKLFGKTAIKHVQKGEVLKDGDLGIEHFGYADALSQPQYLNDYQPGKVWDDTTPLSAVLVHDPGAKNHEGHPDLTCYGSFFVFRKLEQHVKAFKEREKLLANTLFPNEPSNAKKEVAGAYMVGRFENGDPVLKHATETAGTNSGAIDNDFTYGAAGDFSRCPYHAHIRLTNPRESDPVAMKAAIPGYKAPARITRRGIPYDEAGRSGVMDWLPDEKVGLLFMAYQSSIEDSFETMQISANIADGVIGQETDKAHQLWPMQWGNEHYQLKGLGFSGFVTMKGGEYFFAPSIPFLKTLGG